MKHGAAGGPRARKEGGGLCASSGPTQRAAQEERRPRVAQLLAGAGSLEWEPLPVPACLFSTHCPHFSDFFCCTKSKVILHVNIIMTSSVFHRKSNIIYKTTNKRRVTRTPRAKRPSVN